MWFVSNHCLRPLFTVFLGLYAFFLAMPYLIYSDYHNISQVSYYLFNYASTFSFTAIRCHTNAWKLRNHNCWNSDLQKGGLWILYVSFLTIKMGSKIPLERSMFRRDMKRLHYYYVMIEMCIIIWQQTRNEV